jgi:hypothetical protein
MKNNYSLLCHQNHHHSIDNSLSVHKVKEVYKDTVSLLVKLKGRK